PKLYKSVIEDVIEGVRELFTEEGIEEQVLKDLKQLWETKVMQSKATEGFFRLSHPSPQFAVQLPHSFHRALQASAASLVIPTGRGFQHFTAADLGASRPGATVALPSGVAYPLHVPAGVALQTACGHLYKVNVPVVVTQAPGDARVLQHPIQIFQPLGQPSVVQASVVPASAAPVQAAAAALQPLEPASQQSVVPARGSTGGKCPESSTGATLGQQQIATTATLNQQADLTEKATYGHLRTAVFPPEASAVCSLAEALANNPSNPLPDVEGQLDPAQPASLQQQVPDDLLELLVMGGSQDDHPVLKEQGSAALAGKMQSAGQMEPNLQPGKEICSDFKGIIQLDGAGDFSPKEERSHTKDMEENEFIGFIESEDLKVLDDEDEEEDEEGDSLSSTESSSSSSDNEEPQIDIVEEDPLNSGDDVSEQDTPDLFDTDNVIVCQYDKIHRSKNKWKFYLKDGMMCFGGKDYVFAKAIGDAEW
ncbi:TF2AY factor, partial [Eudromia elegans]|nr:TF2AY factor [Eudromia elegans]